MEIVDGTIENITIMDLRELLNIFWSNLLYFGNHNIKRSTIRLVEEDKKKIEDLCQELLLLKNASAKSLEMQ